MTRTAKTLLLSLLALAALWTAMTVPAAAERRAVTVQMADGSVTSVILDVPETATLQDLRSLVPGEPIGYSVLEEPDIAPPPAPAPETTTQTTPEPPPVADLEEDSASTTGPGPILREKGGNPAPRPKTLRFSKPLPEGTATPQSQAKDEADARRPAPPAPTVMRQSDGSPAPSNPGFVEALPGPSYATGVPNFVIRKFRVPVFLLPIYQAAGIEYGVRWEVLAAINEIETDYGRNLNVSSAGALGWMQFIPSSWKAYGVDANKDGKKDPYNPVDAIFAAARYLKAAGYEDDVRGAIFAYNHADWYVDSVMLRARLISGVPADLVGSLTGLTEGRFPVAARARYADDVAEAAKARRFGAGENAANVVESDDGRESIDVFARRGAPVVAVQDGRVVDVGRSKALGRFVRLRDVYGNTYTYSGLGSVSKLYPAPRDGSPAPGARQAQALAANPSTGAADDERSDPAPTTPASRGRQPAERERGGTAKKRISAASGHASVSAASTAVKERLFAHPDMPASRASGGLEQLMDMDALGEGGFASYANRFARPVSLDGQRFRLERLKAGAQVIGGTILGRVGSPDPDRAAHVDFAIRPAGKGAPLIDPKPILDGWKLLEATAIYRASGRNALRSGSGYSIGQLLLLSKPQLERRVLADQRIDIYEAGRLDIRSGQIDRRVLATLAYLAESGMRPTITSLKSGHGFLTASGNVSHHSSGNAVDIAQINGIPIAGHQEAGGITEQAVRKLMSLQGTMAPDQIISLLDLGANTLALSDHDDHIHVGFAPRFGTNPRLGAQAEAVLKPGQWPELLQRLEDIENPTVPTKASPYAIPAGKPLQGMGELGR